MYSRFNKIKDLSDRRRLPVLGKIRLGLKVEKLKADNTKVEYPKETDYFVVPDEVKAVYGEKPKELDIMLPMEDTAAIFPQSYRRYGRSAGLKCEGDGERAIWSDEGEMKDRECPCEHLGKDCVQRAFLRVVLPKISMGGVYQIVTSSFNSIVDVNSSLDYTRALIGRVVMIPLKLRREPRETHHDQKKQVHYTMKIVFDGTPEFINQLRGNTNRILLEQEKVALPVPQEESIAGDEEADIIEKEGLKDQEKAEPPTETSKDPPEAKEERKIEGLDPSCHPKLIVDRIKKILRASKYIGKRESDGKNWELLLIQHINGKATKYSELTREELVDLYWDVMKVGGKLDELVEPY